MTTQQRNTQYEIDRIEVSQPIVVRHIEDRSNGYALVWGFASYILLLPVLFGAMTIATML